MENMNYFKLPIVAVLGHQIQHGSSCTPTGIKWVPAARGIKASITQFTPHDTVLPSTPRNLHEPVLGMTVLACPPKLRTGLICGQIHAI